MAGLLRKYGAVLPANQVEGDRRVATFLTVIGEEAYSLLRTVVAPDKPSRKSYEELVEALQTHLNPIVIAERCFIDEINKKVKQSATIWLN